MTLGDGVFDYTSSMLSIGDRVYPLTLPQGVELPALTFQVVSENPLLHHTIAQDDPLHSDRRLERTRVQFNCYGNTYREAQLLYRELLSVIVGYRGLWGDVEIEAVLPDISLDDYEPATGKWRRLVDVFVHHIPADGS